MVSWVPTRTPALSYGLRQWMTAATKAVYPSSSSSALAG